MLSTAFNPFRNPNPNIGFSISTGNTQLTNVVENTFFLLETEGSAFTGPTGPEGYLVLSGSVNQILVSGSSTGGYTLSTPQDTNTGANISFNSITLTSTGGTATALDYYESDSYNISMQGAWTPTWTARFTRIGKNVTLTFGSDVGPRTVVASNLFSGAGLGVPDGLRPSTSIYGFIYGVDNNINKTLYYEITNGGTITVGNSTTSLTAPFTAGASPLTGPFSWTVTYNIQ